MPAAVDIEIFDKSKKLDKTISPDDEAVERAGSEPRFAQPAGAGGKEAAVADDDSLRRDARGGRRTGAESGTTPEAKRKSNTETGHAAESDATPQPTSP